MILRLAIAVVGLIPAYSLAEPIHDAARSGDVATVRRLLDEGIPADQFDTTDKYGRKTTALYQATKAGRIDVVDVLLDAGADPTLPSSHVQARFHLHQSSHHAMQIAAQFGRVEILQKFLAGGADPNAPGNDSTALHMARVSGHADTVRLLLDAGALPSVEQPSIRVRLKDADPVRGKELFAACSYCHREPKPTGTSNGVMPNLWGVLGREIGSQEGAVYSDALMAMQGVWTYDRLNSFTALPGGFAPGTAMLYEPLEENERLDVIAYLRTLSEDPVPLPE